MPYRKPSEDDKQRFEWLRDFMEVVDDEAKARLREYAAEVRQPATSLAPVACQLYWSWENIDPVWIQTALGMDAPEFWRAVRPGWVEMRCKSCSANVVPVLCEDRSHRDELMCQEFLCPDCMEAADRRATDEINKKIEAARLAREQGAALAAEAERLRAMPYAEYLASPEWKARRDGVVERDGGACRVCSSTERLNVHHRTYERRGDEAPGDLITLCQPCHQLFHENGKLATAPPAPAETLSN